MRSGTLSSTKFSSEFLQPLRISELARPDSADNEQWNLGTGEVSISRRSLFLDSQSLLVAEVGEEDGLEEDVEQCLSCREGVIEVERCGLVQFVTVPLHSIFDLYANSLRSFTLRKRVLRGVVFTPPVGYNRPVSCRRSICNKVE